ncbi:hypothetical protein H1R20_g15443, partial [Candolleomyces eurysporus]
MAPAGTLYTVDVQWKGKAIRAVAALGGVEIALPEKYEHYVDNKKSDFLAKFPHGKIPAWDGADGFKLYESTAIARYIASLGKNANLLGTTPEDAALIEQFIHLADSEVDIYTDFTRAITTNTIPYSKPAHTAFTERQTRALNTLEQHISTRTFFVGERITLADLWVAVIFQKAVGLTVDAAARTKLPNLVRHLETIANQPLSTLNLEDWKRAYSNKETRGAGGALEWFYQNNDPAGYSIWRVDFKYNEELTQVFMSSNQITGFFNRLEAARKYIFGSVGVLGESNNSIITGVFITRGPDHEPVVNVAPDWESYSYTKLDLSNDADKAFFEGALAWDLEVDGKKWADGKNLK